MTTFVAGVEPVMEELSSEWPVEALPGAGDRRPPAASARVSFDEFVIHRTDRLLRTAYLLTRDHGLAEDLLQTALTKAWTAWRRIDRDPEPYVRRIMVNTYATWWRRKWNGERPTGELPETPATSALDDHAERRDLWTALGRLPRRQRAAVVLRYYEGLSEAETAAALGCTVGTVKSSTSRALARLRIDPALATTDTSTQASTQTSTEATTRASTEGGPR